MLQDICIKEEKKANGPGDVGGPDIVKKEGESTVISIKDVPLDSNQVDQLTIDLASSSENISEAVDRYVCTWTRCSKTFLRKTDLTRHQRIHLNDRPFRCSWPSCGKAFMQKSAVKIHYRTHTGEKPNICPFEGCGKAFNDTSSLARHRRTHKYDTPYPCSFRPCPEHFKTRKLLVMHERELHKKQSLWPQLPPPPISRNAPIAKPTEPGAFGYSTAAPMRSQYYQQKPPYFPHMNHMYISNTAFPQTSKASFQPSPNPLTENPNQSPMYNYFPQQSNAFVISPNSLLFSAEESSSRVRRNNNAGGVKTEITITNSFQNDPSLLGTSLSFQNDPRSSFYTSQFTNFPPPHLSGGYNQVFPAFIDASKPVYLQHNPNAPQMRQPPPINDFFPFDLNPPVLDQSDENLKPAETPSSMTTILSDNCSFGF